MANITKTVVFPVPSEWNKDTQDPTNVGIATYEGPDKLITEWYTAPHANAKELYDIYEPNTKRAERPVAVGVQTVLLEVEKNPLHALAWWGCKYPRPERIEVVAGPADEPNPDIPDPHHFGEVFNRAAFHWDQTNNRWSDPVFASDTPGDHGYYGWEHVRAHRNQLLADSDAKVAMSDVPTAVVQPWLDWRQKLRDLPAAWAGVGTDTHLIVWPHDPGEIGAGVTIYGDMHGQEDGSESAGVSETGY